MAESTASEAALLAPWLDHARRAMYGALDDLAEPVDLVDDLWLAWPVADALDEWLLTVETMELLDLFVRVDYKAGWTWILETLEMSMNVSLLDALPNRIFPRYTVCCQLPAGDNDGDAFENIEMLVCGDGGERHSPYFHRVRNEMMKRWKKQVRDPEDRIRVCLEVDLESLDLGHGGEWAVQRLAEITALANDPARRQLLSQLTVGNSTTTARPRLTFCLHRVDIGTGDVPLTNELLAGLCAIHRCGVQVSSLNLDHSGGPQDHLSVPATFDLLRSLVLPEAPASTLLLTRSVDPSTFEAFCSALSVTRSVYDISITLPTVHDDHWAWIAYALFSTDAANRIEYVHLTVDQLTLQDVAQVERVLRARDPLAAFKLSTTGSVQANAMDLLMRDPQVVDVRPNAVGSVRVQRGRTELVSVWIDEHLCTGLRVVNDSFSSTHIAVLYPGVGVCWLRREDIVALRSLPPRDPLSHRGLLRRIGLELFQDTPLEAVLALIRLVGPLTRILLLYAPHGNVLPDSFMRDAIAACPHLERLDLYMVSLASFSWLSGIRSTRLEAMRFNSVSCQDAQGHAAFFEALSDSKSGIGRSLRELALSTSLEDILPWASNVTGMLSMNHRLERVILRAHNVPQGDGDFARLAAQLDAHNGDPLHVQEKPFPLRGRLALLSVLAHREDLRELDAAMLAIIFALAAPHKQRECALTRKLERIRE